MKRLLAGLALGALVLVWLLRSVDLDAVARSIAGASPALLAVAVAAVLVEIWLKGERWAISIAAGRGPRPRVRLFASMLIGTAGNIALPARVGDLARAFVLRKHNGVPVPRSLAASVSVQVLDFLVVALLLATLAPSSQFASTAALAAVVGAAVAILVALALVRRLPAAVAWIGRLPGPFGRIGGPLAKSAHDGLAYFDSAGALAAIALSTAAIWLVEAVAATAALRAFGLDLPLAAGPLLSAAIGLSFVLPLTPGSLGAIQLIAIFVLGAYGVEREPALAFGLAWQAVAQLPIVALGFAALQREGLDWRTLGAEPRAPEV